MNELTLSYLGQFRASFRGSNLEKFRTNKVQALLIYMTTETALKGPSPQQRDGLVGILWPDMPERSARINLRQTLYQLKKLIPELPATGGKGKEMVPFLIASRQAVQVNPDARYDLDLSSFVQLIRNAQKHQHADLLTCPECQRWLQDAVALYRGPFLADFFLFDSDSFENWAAAIRESLRRKMLDALATLTTIHLHHGNFPQAESLARRQLEIDDLRESAYQQLMEILARSGRQSEALAVYEQARDLLDAELGMAPTKNTTAVFEQIRAGDMDITTEGEHAVRGYVLAEEIGAGYFGIVYRAHQPTVDREVAIKIISPRHANRPDFIRQFDTEAKMIARLEHPHIVPLYDYWREPDSAYLVMRWLRGGSLRLKLDEGPWNLEATVVMVEQIADALSSAHRRGLVHCDLKPANILLDDDGNAYLSDFNVARNGSSNWGPDIESIPARSLAYSTPEQLLNEDITPLTDQYSFGVVIYEALTGEKPFPETSLAELLDRHLQEALPPITRIRPEIPSAVDRVIQRATSKQPKARYPTILDMASSLREAANLGPVAVFPTVSGKATRSDAPNPYKGLRAFEEADAEDFFGREALVERLLSRLGLSSRSSADNVQENGGSSRFLAVVGASGIGKSSVVRAGLIPALRHGRIEGSEKWFVVLMNPGGRPIEALDKALMQVAVNPPPSLVEPLKKDHRGLARILKRILPREENGERGQLLLIIDQFEELFVMGGDDEITPHFLNSLLTAVNDAHSQLRVVVTLRADFYDRPLQYQAFGELLRGNTEVVLPLNPGEIERAITAPAAGAGVTIEPGLVATIVDDVGKQPGALPMLQYALTELYENRSGQVLTQAAYLKTGGVLGALGNRAEALYRDLDEEGKEATRQLFLHLITLGEGVDDTRRRALRKELESLSRSARTAGERMSSVIEAYGRHRLLTFDRDPLTRERVVEIAHEALIQNWKRLGNWLDESRDDLHLQRQLARMAVEWSQEDRDPSFLLRGARLERFLAWGQETELSMTEGERNFLQSSAALRDEKAAAEAARQAHEEKLKRRTRQVLQALVVVLLAAAAISAWFAVDANRQRGETERNFARSESQRLAAEANYILQREGSPELASLLALRGLEAHYTSQADLALQRAADSLEASVLIETPGGAILPTLSPDNRYLTFARPNPPEGGPPVSELWDLNAMERLWQTTDYMLIGAPIMIRNVTADYSGVVAWPLQSIDLVSLDLQSGAPLFTFQGSGSPIVTHQLSDDGSILAAGMEDGSVYVWKAETGEEIRRFSVGGRGYARESGRELLVALSPDAQQAVATAAGQTHVWEIESGEQLYSFEHEHDYVYRPTFADDGRVLMAAFAPVLSLWDLSTGQEIEHELPRSSSGIISPDGRVYAQGLVGETEQDVVLWDVASGRELHRLSGHSDGGRPVAFTDNGRQLVTWGWEGTARLWDVSSGQQLQVLAGHTDAIQEASLSPDGRLLVTTGQDETLRIWDLQAPSQRGYRLERTSVVFQVSPDGQVALTAEPGTGNAVLVEPDSLNVLHRLDFKLDPILGGPTSRKRYSGDGRLVLGISDSGTILVYDVATGELTGEYANPDGVYKYPTFVPGGDHILAGGDRGAYLLDAKSGEQLHLFETPGTDVRNPYSNLVAVSNDGRYGAMHVITLDERYAVYLWDLETESVVFQPEPHPTDFVVAFAFSDDGRYFAWGGTENIVYIRDLQSGEEVARLSHLDSVHNIDFSSDGRKLLTSTGGDGVLLWDFESGEVERRFYADSGQAGFVRFVEDDTSVLYSTFEDGVIYQQPLAIDSLVESMCDRMLRDLTPVERELYGLDDSPTCPESIGS